MAYTHGLFAREWRRWLPLGIVCAGVWAYHTSLSGPFLFDDHRQIVHHLGLRHLWPLWPLLTSTIRPVVTLSLALNYAVGGLNVLGYHLVNLTIHLLAALALYGVARRTGLTARVRHRFASSAPWLALSLALLWVVHPLATQSVTYLIQRAESLMSLCYLLTLYCAVRSVESQAHQRWWCVAAILACAAGMASKAVMVTAPLMVLLYDRIFLASSLREALRRRRGLYAGLASTWGLLALLLTTETHLKSPSAGFGYQGVTPWAYALTQPQVILHYLRLAIWPQPLVLDYLWPAAASLQAIVVPTLAVGVMLLATRWALRRAPAVGFLGAWVFGILAPTSSLIPISDLAVEHRMYLPLAGVLALLVVSVHRALQRLTPAALRRGLAAILVLIAVGALGRMTLRRNDDYRSEWAMWTDVLAKRPNSFRALSSLGDWLRREGHLPQAIVLFEETRHLMPDHPEVHYNLGFALMRAGRSQEAIASFTEALRLRPDYPEAHNDMGIALSQQGQFTEALFHYSKAIEFLPEYADAYYNLGNVYVEQGRVQDAKSCYLEALRLQPDDADYAEAHNNLGNIFAQQGRLQEALAHYQEALRLDPHYANAYANWGNVLMQQGQIDEAIAHYTAALRLQPDHPAARVNLEMALMRQHGKR